MKAQSAANPIAAPEPAKQKTAKKIHSDSEDDADEDEEEMDRRLAMSSRQVETAEDFWKDDEQASTVKKADVNINHREEDNGRNISLATCHVVNQSTAKFFIIYSCDRLIIRKCRG
jgi:hypothetical protein